jgi:hypothetical protein
MKRKAQTESDRFDRMMDGLLAVPYKELQEKIEKEKVDKAKRKKRAITSPASRASVARKS